MTSLTPARPGVRRAAAALALAALAGTPGACAEAAPTPATVTPEPTADPRIEEIEEGRGVWERRGPGTLAYTVVETAADGSSTTVHVAQMDGRAEQLVLAAADDAPPAGPDQTIDGLFDRALAAAAAGEATIEFDPTYGHIVRLLSPAGSVEVTDLRTPADRGEAARARAGLDELLQRWASPPSPAWGYTWSRFGAADSLATATTYEVVHEDGETTVQAAGGATGTDAPPGSATIQGTVETAVGVLAAGGWVDVALDPAGLDALVAIDPSPSARDDAYWIRIDATDLYLDRTLAALETARARWASAAPDVYTYRWTYRGDAGSWTWVVRTDSGVTTPRPARDAVVPDQPFAGPRIDELFGLVEAVARAGGRVSVTYDEARGFPASVELRGAPGVAPDGVITITRLRAR